MEAEKFQSLRAKCDAKLADMQTPDYPALRREIRAFCSVPSSGSSLQDLATQMQLVQAAKDRLSEFLPAAHDDSIVRRSIADTLMDAYLGVSEASSQDKRKGMAALALGSYEIDAAASEGFFKFCWNHMQILDSKHEAVSRRISCLQLSLKLYDFGGGTVEGMAAPRHTADKFAADVQADSQKECRPWGEAGPVEF